MLSFKAEYQYVYSETIKLFTVVLLPAAEKSFPTIIIRTPYVDAYENMDEDEIAVIYMNEYKNWLKRGYSVVIQHCRGTGKSEGDCIPYINERADGLNLQEWIRKQPFYNGELFLKGVSYLTSVHYVTAPFANDIKGAVFGVQDSNRYNICYRNGFLKKALHGSWYVGMYKKKSHMKKNYTNGTFDMLPLKDFTKTVFGETAEDFDATLCAPNPNDEFWNTKFGGIETIGATDNINFPVLFTTGFYDIYTGGIFDMWNNMSEESRKRCALVVSPYDHNDTYNAIESVSFPEGRRAERFGADYEIEWFDYVRRTRKEAPFETNKITYYRLFENTWATECIIDSEKTLDISFGKDEKTYVYNPFDAPRFKGGLSTNFGGTVFQDKPNSRHDIVSVYSEPFKNDVFVKGKMKAKLTVKSDCEDTCFYVRISIEKEQGDYGLRDDITSLVYQLGDYSPDSVAEVVFDFDEHAFLVKKGERLRVDIASADNEHYVRHTNQKGLYSEQTTAKIAHNTIYLDESVLILPVE